MSGTRLERLANDGETAALNLSLIVKEYFIGQPEGVTVNIPNVCVYEIVDARGSPTFRY